MWEEIFQHPEQAWGKCNKSWEKIFYFEEGKVGAGIPYLIAFLLCFVDAAFFFFFFFTQVEDLW